MSAVCSAAMDQQAAAADCPSGDLAALNTILQQLEEPLEELDVRPARQFAQQLRQTVWPEDVREEVAALAGLIASYQFVRAREQVGELSRRCAAAVQCDR